MVCSYGIYTSSITETLFSFYISFTVLGYLLLGFFFLELFSTKSNTQPSPFLTKYKTVFLIVASVVMLGRILFVIAGQFYLLSSVVVSSISGMLLIVQMVLTLFVLVLVVIKCKKNSAHKSVGKYARVLSWINHIVIAIVTCLPIFLMGTLILNASGLYTTTYFARIVFDLVVPLVPLFSTIYCFVEMFIPMIIRSGRITISESNSRNNNSASNSKNNSIMKPRVNKNF